MKKNIFFATIIISTSYFVNLNTYAANVLSKNIYLDSPKYLIEFSLGPTWTKKSATQTLVLAPEIEKTFTGDSATPAVTQAKVFFGLPILLNPNLENDIGAELGINSRLNFSGQIWDDALPQFNNYSYHYQLQHSDILIKNKLLLKVNPFITPWINAGVGLGFNRASDFFNQALIDEAVAMPNFKNHTTTSITYTVGAGLQHNFTPACQIGLGYEFSNWGHSSLGTAPGQTLGKGLSFNHYYTNAVLMNVSYYF